MVGGAHVGPVDGLLLGPGRPREPVLVAGSAAGWSAAARVLAVRLDGLGDLLMTTPALRALRAQRPDRHLALLASSAGSALGPLLPEVDEVVAWDPPWMKAAPAAGRDAPAFDRAIVDRLAGGRFDAAVIFTVHTQSPLPAALACRLAGIPRVLAHCRENPYRLLSDWVAEPEPDQPSRHETRRQLDLVRAVGAIPDEEHLSVRVPPDAARRVRGRLAALGIRREDPWLLVHPGASAASRRYPATRFASAIRAVRQLAGWPVVVTGGPGEVGMVAEIAEAAGPRVHAVPIEAAAGVGELAALIAAAPLLLANNSGPGHLAAAVGTPVVVLYALTNLQHAPWGVPSRALYRDVPCRGCRSSVCLEGHHRCLLDVAPEEVAAACLDLAAQALAA